LQYYCALLACLIVDVIHIYSNRFLISGSDYGERRLMIWDAQMPKYNSYVQLPHMIFWTPEGLIQKILIQQKVPEKEFWLSASQLSLLDEDETVTVWPGELTVVDDIDDESDEDIEKNDEADVPPPDLFGQDDVREVDGATVMVIAVAKNGEQMLATEYIAGGGTLVISIQVMWLIYYYYLE
jgi:hypothetical protein